MLPDRVENGLLLACISGLQGRDMGGQVVVVEKQAGCGHLECRSLGAGGDPEQAQAGQQGRGGDCPADPQSRDEDRGKAAQVNDPSLGVQRLEGGQVLTGKPDVATGGIFQNDQAVAVGQRDQLLAAGKRQGDARRILEIRDRLDHPRLWIGLGAATRCSVFNDAAFFRPGGLPRLGS